MDMQEQGVERTTDDLQKLRARIDAADDRITDLFVERMALARQIADCKKEQGLAVYHASREREVLARVTARGGAGMEEYLRALYQTIFETSRSYQTRQLAGEGEFARRIAAALRDTPQLFPKQGVVACQGVEGAYSQQACDKLFAMPNILYFRHFEGVFQAVSSGMCQYGVLPIENSSNGTVGQVYDLMRNYRFHIVRSIKLCVRHSLLAKKGVRLADIREIYSHEQAIGQCSRFLKELKDVQVHVCENTAAAAKMVAESERRDIAALSSTVCAQLYGLDVISEHVQNNDNNYTRFICISKELEIYPGANKISLMLSTSHRPGALYGLIAKFAVLGINLTKLESRPIPGSDFEFIFYFDLDASVLSPEVISLLNELEAAPELFVFLGNYAEVH